MYQRRYSLVGDLMRSNLDCPPAPHAHDEKFQPNVDLRFYVLWWRRRRMLCCWRNIHSFEEFQTRNSALQLAMPPRGKTLELQSLELRYCTQLIAITLLNSFQFPIILGYDSIGLYLPLLMLVLHLHVSAALQLGRRPDEVQFGLSASSTCTWRKVPAECGSEILRAVMTKKKNALLLAQYSLVWRIPNAQFCSPIGNATER